MENSDYILPEKIICPNCNELIELDEVERKKKVFTCPLCYVTNDMTTLLESTYFETNGNVLNQDISESLDEIGPKGVGGWLLFFCISLTILSPLLTIFTLLITFKESEWYFSMYPGFETVTYMDLFLSIGLMAFSIYAGFALWSVKKDAVKIAKNYLKTFLFYVIISSILPFMAGLPSSANSAIIGQVIKDDIRQLFYFGIWFSYLNISKRVLATYYTMDKDVLKKYVQENKRLPEVLQCPECREELKLEEKEQIEMKYQCPSCNIEIDLMKDKEFSELIQDEKKYIEEKKRLSKLVKCPKCGAELEFNEKEQIEMKYKCPCCNEEIDRTNIL